MIPSKKDSVFQKIINKNLAKVSNFYVTHLPDCIPKTVEKVGINCPFCQADFEHPYGDTKHHMVINIDWGTAKCFRCGTAKSNIQILKHFDIYRDFINLITTLADLTVYDVQSILKAENVSNHIEEKIEKDAAIKYIKSNNLLPISRLKLALDYAYLRTRSNKNEVNSYLADDVYIYVPIINDKKIVAFIARKYNQESKATRYKFIKIYEDQHPIAFLDEISENLSSDIVYITEGYFDAYAINASYGDHKAVGILGQSISNNVLGILKNNIPSDVQLIIVLDSIEKNPEILGNVSNILKKLQKYFYNIKICMLPESDPSYIYVKYGPSKLIEVLRNNLITTVDFRRKQISDMITLNNKTETVDFAPKLPDFLLRKKKLIQT